MTLDKLIYRGLDGETIKTGDLVAFSYGIPPVRVEGPVSVKDGQLYMATPGHGPGGGTLAFIDKHAGPIWKVSPQPGLKRPALQAEGRG